MNPVTGIAEQYYRLTFCVILNYIFVENSKKNKNITISSETLEIHDQIIRPLKMSTRLQVNARFVCILQIFCDRVINYNSQMIGYVLRLPNRKGKPTAYG